MPCTNAGGTITLTVNTGCEFTFSKAVDVGAPGLISLQEDLVASDACSKITWYDILNYDPLLTYSGTGLTGISNGRFRVKGATGSQRKAFTVTATNGCGSTTLSSSASFSECGARYAAYPNPAADELTVAQTQESDDARSPAARSSASSAAGGPAASTPFIVRLYDTYGTLHLEQATAEPTLRLRVGALPAGLYLLRIEADGATVASQQIQLTH